MPLSARDRAAVLKVLEQAQLAYGLTLLPKKNVVSDPAGIERLRERLAAIREAADGLSKELRDQTKVPWLLLMNESEEPDKVWTTAKKAIPKLVKELTPLVSDAPEAAFFSGIPAKERSGNGKPAKPPLRVVKKTMRLTLSLSCPRCGRLIEQRLEIDAPMTAARASKEVASAGAEVARDLASELAEHLRSKHGSEEED